MSGTWKPWLKVERELPCSDAQKNMRLSRDLLAKRNAPFGKFDVAAGFHESGVTFLFHFDENVTVAAREEL